MKPHGETQQQAVLAGAVAEWRDLEQGLAQCFGWPRRQVSGWASAVIEKQRLSRLRQPGGDLLS